MNNHQSCLINCGATDCTAMPEEDWDHYEEDGPLDLEEQLDRELDKRFPSAR